MEWRRYRVVEKCKRVKGLWKRWVLIVWYCPLRNSCHSPIISYGCTVSLVALKAAMCACYFLLSLYTAQSLHHPQHINMRTSQTTATFTSFHISKIPKTLITLTISNRNQSVNTTTNHCSSPTNPKLYNSKIMTTKRKRNCLHNVN